MQWICSFYLAVAFSRKKKPTPSVCFVPHTEIFGSSPARSEQLNEKLKRLGQLNIRAALGKIKPEEETERLELEKIFTTDAPTGF